MILDRDNLAPGFTYGRPILCCTGIDAVLADGVITYTTGRLTGKTPGGFLPR